MTETWNLIHTFLCLIPKTKKPTMTSEFRPISLHNVIYKIVTKVIANWLKLILADIINASQNAFVLGPLITDNALIAFAVFHYMRRKTKVIKVMGYEIGYVQSLWQDQVAFSQGSFE